MIFLFITFVCIWIHNSNIHLTFPRQYSYYKSCPAFLHTQVLSSLSYLAIYHCWHFSSFDLHQVRPAHSLGSHLLPWKKILLHFAKSQTLFWLLWCLLKYCLSTRKLLLRIVSLFKKNMKHCVMLWHEEYGLWHCLEPKLKATLKMC